MQPCDQSGSKRDAQDLAISTSDDDDDVLAVEGERRQSPKRQRTRGEVLVAPGIEGYHASGFSHAASHRTATTVPVAANNIPCPRDVAQRLERVMMSQNQSMSIQKSKITHDIAKDVRPRPPPSSPVHRSPRPRHIAASVTNGVSSRKGKEHDRVFNNDRAPQTINRSKSMSPKHSNGYSNQNTSPTSPHTISNRVRVWLLYAATILLISVVAWRDSDVKVAIPPPSTISQHILPPTTTSQLKQSSITLRDYLLHPDGIDLAMAPAFFGFYGYIGALIAWKEELDDPSFLSSSNRIHAVAGASAGAMVAILLAAGIDPTTAAQFCTASTLDQFADPPALGAAFKGNKFEQLMHNFLVEHTAGRRVRMEDAILPVAVSGFDLQTMSGVILRRGSMARAARASATFPLLFQPVGWTVSSPSSKDELDDLTASTETPVDDYTLIDGGITDAAGLNGLEAISIAEGEEGRRRRRVVNLVVGDFVGGVALGPSRMPTNLDAVEVLSITLQNLPACGPWAMQNGPLAVEAARRVMQASMDLPLYEGLEPGHFELHLDASVLTSIPDNAEEQ